VGVTFGSKGGEKYQGEKACDKRQQIIIIIIVIII
jgi:hypothetical protein